MAVLGETIQAYVPNSLQKLVFCNNNISDRAMAKFLNSLMKLRSGLRTIAIINNNTGEHTIKALNSLFHEHAMREIQKIILKDVDSRLILERELFCKNLFDSHINFNKVQMLVLQNVNMSKEDLVNIAKFCEIEPTLHFLDISHNNLTVLDLTHFFNQIHYQTSNIDSLNISWLRGKNHKHYWPAFDKALATFLRFSRTIDHVDISGLPFPANSLEHLALRGLRKSKTL
jgi:hypothetical protein